jgi:RNA polymerase sigma-70 factor (ECF subfamily)
MKEGLLTSGITSVVQSKLAKGHFGDTQLVELLRLGDGDAFAVLTRRYEKRLLRIAVRITKNTEDSEDAVQEAFLKAYWRIETFRGQSSFSTWLTRIVINTCLMQLRKNRTRPHVSLDETNENGTAWVDYLPDRAVDIEAAYARQETSELLANAIMRLKPTLRSVVDGYQQYDCTMAELAERNGLSIAAVKSRLLRARTALKNSAIMTSAR